MKIDLNTKKEFSSPASAFIDMMGGQKNDIQEIPIDDLIPYPEQKTFRTYRSEKLLELCDNIKSQGILSPVIVRPITQDDREVYQILAGHNRTAAAKMAGMATVPCIVKNADDKAAREIFVYTNLEQRDKLLPSEKAAAYKLLMDADKDGECQFDTAEKIAKDKGDSRRQIFRFLRLNYLIKPYLSQVDNSLISLNAAVNLSYLNEQSQWLLSDYVSRHKLKITMKKSETLKDSAQDGALTYEIINNVFRKPEKSMKKLKLPLNEIGVYFGDLDESEIAEKVISIIKEHYDGRSEI